MKLNKNQLAVLQAVKASKKATYAQAIANGGNGRTVGYLVESNVLTVNAPKKEGMAPTYSLTPAGADVLKEATKAAAKLSKTLA